MNFKNLLFFICFSLLVTACREKSAFSIIEIFNKTEQLTGKTLNITGFQENMFNPADMEIIGNYMVLLDVQAPVPFYVIDLEKRCYLRSFGMKGQGPGEVVGIMDFYVNPDRTGINFWDVMLKRLYFCNTDSLSVYKNKCGVDLFENTTNKKLLNAFFLNVLQLRDNLYLGIGNNGEKRFCLINTLTNKTIYTGDYTSQKKSTESDPIARAIAYNGTIRFNKERNRIVYISRESEMVELYDVTDAGLKLVYRNTTTTPESELTSTEEDRGRCLGIAVTDQRIFILCQPRTTDPNVISKRQRNNTANDVIVFDWNGKPFIHYKLDENVASIAVTDDGKCLYALVNNVEPMILYYNIQ